jgi:hypothetical protein
MIVYIQRLLYDATFFERFARTVVFAVCEYAKQGLLPVGSKGWYFALMLQPLALFMPAGEKNEK